MVFIANWSLRSNSHHLMIMTFPMRFVDDIRSCYLVLIGLNSRAITKKWLKIIHHPNFYLGQISLSYAETQRKACRDFSYRAWVAGFIFGKSSLTGFKHALNLPTWDFFGLLCLSMVNVLLTVIEPINSYFLIFDLLCWFLENLPDLGV